MDEKKSPTSLLSNQSGQGVIEYILVLSVIVLVILGVTYQFNSAFKVWANNYFGEYLACLLETGELPSLGATNAIGFCEEHFKPFSLADGRPFIDVTSKGSGGATSGSFTPNKGAVRSSRSSSRSTSGGGGSSRSSFGRSSFGGSPRRFRTFQARAPNTTTSAVSDASADNGDSFSRGGSDFRRRKLIRVRRQGLAGGASGGGAEDKDQKEKAKKKGKKSADQTEILNRQKLIKVNPKKKSKELNIDEEDELQFGSFIRFLIIIAIIIALVLLLGGQALQIRKSME